jgi:hypothetical protein
MNLPCALCGIYNDPESPATAPPRRAVIAKDPDFLGLRETAAARSRRLGARLRAFRAAEFRLNPGDARLAQGPAGSVRVACSFSAGRRPAAAVPRIRPARSRQRRNLHVANAHRIDPTRRLFALFIERCAEMVKRQV